MTKKKALLIINPVSGTRSKQGLDSCVKRRLEKSGITTECFMTAAPGDAATEAKKAVEQDFDMVIVAGGDGTVNEVANALAFSDCTLGIIPFGSGNGLARSLSIPQNLDEALKIIEEANVLECDRGIVNSRPFYCTFGVGFDAAVSQKFSEMKRRGRISYIRSAMREFLHYKGCQYTIKTDDKILTKKAFLMAVCNASQYGNNAYISPGALLNDGLLDVTLVHDDSRLHTILMGLRLFTGTLDKDKKIGHLKVSGLTILRQEEGPVHLDGEPVNMGPQLEISCQQKAVKIFKPKKEEHFRPYISPLRAFLADMKFDVMEKFRFQI